MLYNKYKRNLWLILLITGLIPCQAQVKENAEIIIDELCSETYAGRGYINEGDVKAAKFIASEFKKAGLEELESDYLQYFKIDVNTFPVADLVIDGKDMRDGYDYLVSPSSPSLSISANVFYVSEKLLMSKKVGKKVASAIKKGMIPVVANVDSKNKDAAKGIERIATCSKSSPVIYLKDHLTWSMAQNQKDKVEIWMLESSFDKFAKKIDINIKAELKRNYRTQNVMGYVPGTEFPDSFIIFCGHYDHLGKMGSATFSGANDNASGIAMLIEMAKHFGQNPQKYSIAFVAFGAEEVGLLGSLHYVKNTPIKAPLRKTKFVFNMDLMGSGEKGATIVNGSVYPNYFDQLVAINERHEYLPKIGKRGKAANSDHYFFSEAGVPSFFIYLMGEYKHYHIPQDNAENLELSGYFGASFELIKEFIIELSN